MALQHTLLEVTGLSAAAQKALSAGPMKMMAARGMAPLSDPRDLISVLYQLCLDAEAGIKSAAAKSVEGLPENILKGALADANVDPRVLDFFAGKFKANGGLIQLVVLNKATADDTLAELARTADQDLVDLMSQNEERLLRFPPIIASMYHNPAARMSTVDRVVELAVRTEIKVEGIPAWAELTRAVLGKKAPEPEAVEAEAAGEPEPELDSTAADAMFAKAASVLVEEDGMAVETVEAKEVPIGKMTIPMKIRLATLGNKFARSTLVRDRIAVVALAAIKAPGMTDAEAAKHAGNSALSDDVITYIANKREWTKLYKVKLSLILNPKTPMPVAMRFMNFMRDKDLRMIARSKGIPSAVAAKAKSIIKNKMIRGG